MIYERGRGAYHWHIDIHQNDRGDGRGKFSGTAGSRRGGRNRVLMCFLVGVDGQLTIHGFEVGVFAFFRVHGQDLQVDFVVVYEQESGYLGRRLGRCWNAGAGVFGCLGYGLGFGFGFGLGGCFCLFVLLGWGVWNSPG